MIPLTPAQRAVAYAMSEAELQAAVCRLAEGMHIYWHHVAISLRSRRGWPDLALLGNGGSIFAELKRETGRLTPDQRMVGIRLTAAGLTWVTWRPSDLLSGTIARQLAAIAGLREAA